MLAIWLEGLLRRRPGLILGQAAGVALAVALLALLGAFLVMSSRSMTARSIAAVPVDWQIQLAPGADPKAVSEALAQAAGYRKLQPVGYGDAAGFVAHTGATVQTTGPGKVLGIGPSYGADFPGQIRPLIGASEGVLLAQQTAANLHATVGDRIAIERAGLATAEVKIEGIVDLPNADSLFQPAGLPPGLAPQAPPDNVVILPLAQWHKLFDPLAAAQPGSVRSQLHVSLSHDRLPPDPAAAYDRVSGAARNLEARIAGAGVVADNLAARLDAVRSDALYARVLFLFLGMPGALLAILLTHAVAVSGAGRRRREQSLLRIRGASITQILRLVALEAGPSASPESCSGLPSPPSPLSPSWAAISSSRAGLGWIAAAALLGLAASAAAVLLPAWLEARQLTVAGAAAPIGQSRRPLWRRLYLDLLLLALSAVLFWQMQRQGYQIVLAPEGVPAASVDYDAFISPTLLWIALALISARLLGIALGPGRSLLAAALRPVAGHLAGLVAAGPSSPARPGDARLRGGAAGDVLRHLDGGLRRDIPRPGPRRCGADQWRRCRRDRQRRAASRRLPGKTGGAARRRRRGADAASFRLCRRRPSGSLRHRAALDRQGDAHVQRLFPERQCRRDAGVPGGDPGRSPGLRGDGPGLSASARRQDQSSPAERRGSPVSRGTLPPRRHRAGIPDRAEKFLPGRQCRLCRAADRLERGGDRSAAQPRRSDPAGERGPRNPGAGIRSSGSRTSAARSALSIPA